MAYNNPANAAMPYLNQIPGMMEGYFNPYISSGQNAMGMLQGQYGNLINDPNAMIAKWGAGYQQSPGYQFQVDQATKAANRAGAAGGMLGSPMEQQQLSGTINNLANQDFQQYLQNVMGAYGLGLSGEQNINQMGFNASDDLARSLAENMQNQAQLAYSGQQNQNQYDQYRNQQRQGWWGAGLGAVSSALPWVAGMFL